ncbi:MAG: tRNA (guanosine(46)-N7)-methyltransferase TrmB [Bdellovibrionales bacterium]|nr:tRNA (guanosine(46)-N7)-methyltransferase TrmB [Bdellovibrionales bacterium]
MSRGAQTQISKTKDLKNPNEYVLALSNELRSWAFDEEQAPRYKGHWRDQIFEADSFSPLDLEIGTGNGFHFAEHAKRHPNRNLLGIELKYKPLVQAIRRVLRQGGTNARILRYNAVHLDQLFEKEELNNVYIHFPDPWEKLRQNKHRLIQLEFLNRLFHLQKSGAFVEFKTDSRDYYLWARERFEQSPYVIIEDSENLHQSAYAAKNFVTHFESIFLRKSLPIHYCRLQKVQQNGAIRA